MKKITQSILLTLFTMLTMYGQEPFYNFSVALISTSGSTETYQVTALGTEMTPSVYNLQDFNITIGSAEGNFINPAMITTGAYGVTSAYSEASFPASVVNGAFSPASPSTEDLFSITYADAVYTDLSSYPTTFNLVQFSVDRATAPAGVYPTVVGNSDISVVNLVDNGFNVVNSFITDVDGIGVGADATERFSDATLSIPGVDFNGISFKAFPNPSTDILNINNPTMNEYTYSVSNLLGQDVGINGTLKPHRDTELSLGHLENAIYFVSISSGTNKKTIKILINE